MIKDKINVFKNLEELNKGFTTFVKNIAANNAQVNVSLSGGSTPKSLFGYWVKEEKDSMPWKQLYFYWGDERCVPPTDEMSNYGMTKEYLFDHVAIPEKNIFRIHGENDPIEEAKAYSKVLDSNLIEENGVPAFELVILGLGDDGHTVSIFPHEMQLWNSPENCVVAKHPESGMQRVSLTGKIVDNAQNVVFLVTGKNKAEKVRDIIKHRADFENQYPAAKVNPISKTIYWFMDEDAAGLL